jgi:hypothetical protein
MSVRHATRAIDASVLFASDEARTALRISAIGKFLSAECRSPDDDFSLS